MIGSPFFSFFSLESNIILLLVLFRQADKSIYHALSCNISVFMHSSQMAKALEKSSLHS